MSNIIALTEVLGRKVVALDDAEDIGTFEAIVPDRAGRVIERIQIGGRKRSPELVDWDRVTSVGKDAVMVESADAAHQSREDEPDDLYVRGKIEIIGARVLDTDGFEAGEVTDLHFDTETGEITAAMTDDGRIPAERIRSLGTYALVIDG